MRLVSLAIMMCGAWLISTPARAGGGSSSDTGSGSDTGTNSDTCGSCTEPAASVMFVSPADGAEVPADAMITFEVGYACSCDDCGCYEDQPASYSVYVDEELVLSCFDGCTGTQTIDLQLTPGAHEILVSAEYTFHSEGATLTVSVVGGPGTDSTDGASTSPGDDGTSAASGGGNGGGKGGCRMGEPAEAASIGGLLLALGLLRRRERRVVAR